MRLRLRERGGESEGKRLREKVTHRHSHTQTQTHRHRHTHTHTHHGHTHSCVHSCDAPAARASGQRRGPRCRWCGPCSPTPQTALRGDCHSPAQGRTPEETCGCVCAGVRAGVWGEGKEVVQEWAGGCMCVVACAWVRNTVRDRGTVCACVDRTSSPKTRALMAGRALAGATATSSTTCSCAVSVNLHSPPLLAHTRTVCCGHANMHQRR